MDITGLTLFGSGIALGIVLLLLFISLIAADLSESGWFAAVCISVVVILNAFWGTIPILDILTLKNILLYLIIGFIFSMVRTYFKGKELSKDDKKHYDLKSSVFRWWFLFPISLINWVFGDLLKDLFNWIYSKIESIYLKLFNV